MFGHAQQFMGSQHLAGLPELVLNLSAINRQIMEAGDHEQAE